MDFIKEDRPFGEKVEQRYGDAKEELKEFKEDTKGFARRVEGELTGDRELQREHEPSTLERAGDQLKEGAATAKEDLKGAARRVEGEIRCDEGLKQEHEPSMLERAGEAIQSAAESVRDTIAEGAKKIGLVSDETRKE